MKATDLLKKQHERVDKLFEEIDQTEDAGEKEALLEELADNLAAHTTIEEQLFYPAVYTGELKDMLGEAVEEHLSMKRLLVDLMAMDADDDSFDAKLTVLQEQKQHHVDEEEKELFPRVEKLMGHAELELLGARMQAMFESEMDDVPRDKLSDQTGEAAPLH